MAEVQFVAFDDVITELYAINRSDVAGLLQVVRAPFGRNCYLL
jgi:hypothetical protein